MKKRVIRLTESDLEKIVRKVLSEQMPAPDMTKPVKYFTGTKQVESELGGMFNGRLLNFFDDEAETEPILLKYKVNRVKSDENEPALKFEVSPTVKGSTYPKGVVGFECNDKNFMFEPKGVGEIPKPEDPKLSKTLGILNNVFNEKLKSDLERVFCSRLKKSKSGTYLSPSTLY